MQKDFSSYNKQKATIVQGNVLSGEKWEGKSSYSTYLKESLLVSETDTIVVWPETAVPTALNDSEKLLSELNAYTVFSGNNLFLGAFYNSSVGNEYNAAYYFSNGKLNDSLYFKRKLVPFGEFLPMSSFLRKIPILDGINLYSTDLSRGIDTAVINTEKGNIGCLICFDSIFPYLARKTASDGAELIMIITNDSWYKDDPAVFQHHNQAIWRAVENGKFVVRAANSGVSSVISPNGEVISSLPPLVKGTITETVYYIPEKTLYTDIGDIVIFPMLAVVLLCLIITVVKKPPSATDVR